MKKIDLSKYLTICIEFKCQNNCLSCMLRDIKKILKPVSFKKYKAILNENLRIKKYNSLTLSGAEVTTNKNLLKYVEYAKNHANLENIRIQTNGRKLADYEYSKKLVQTGANEFFVSIFSSKPEIHDKITRAKNSLEQTLDGIKNLNKLGSTIITNTVVSRLNYKTLPLLVSKLVFFKMLGESNFGFIGL